MLLLLGRAQRFPRSVFALLFLPFLLLFLRTAVSMGAVATAKDANSAVQWLRIFIFPAVAALGW